MYHDKHRFQSVKNKGRCVTDVRDGRQRAAGDQLRHDKTLSDVGE